MFVFGYSIEVREMGINAFHGVSRTVKERPKERRKNIVRLGDKVKDSMTGFEGVAIARCEYLNGCISIEVRPVKLNDGAMMDAKWIDEQQLTLKSKAGNGGPQSMPTAMSTPR